MAGKLAALADRLAVGQFAPSLTRACLRGRLSDKQSALGLFERCPMKLGAVGLLALVLGASLPVHAQLPPRPSFAGRWIADQGEPPSALCGRNCVIAQTETSLTIKSFDAPDIVLRLDRPESIPSPSGRPPIIRTCTWEGETLVVRLTRGGTEARDSSDGTRFSLSDGNLVIRMTQSALNLDRTTVLKRQR